MYISPEKHALTARSPHLFTGSRRDAGLQVAAKGDPAKVQLERFVYNTFFRHYAAHVSHFMPLMLALRDEQLLSVAGVRSAEKGPLFLEQYIDRPVEHYLATVFHCDVAREEVVEIGNLASTCLGSARYLFIALAALLHQAGKTWVCCVANPSVRAIFRKMHFPFEPLQTVDKYRLGAENTLWGSYYDKGCLLMAARVEDCFQALAANPVHAEVLARDLARLSVHPQNWSQQMNDSAS